MKMKQTSLILVNLKMLVKGLVYHDNDGDDDDDDHHHHHHDYDPLDQIPGCSVHCTPGPSERCIKYTEFSAGKLSYTSRYDDADADATDDGDDGDGDDDGDDGEERCIKYTEFSAGKLYYTSR